MSTTTKVKCWECGDELEIRKVTHNKGCLTDYNELTIEVDACSKCMKESGLKAAKAALDEAQARYYGD